MASFVEPYGPADQIKYVCDQSRREVNEILFGQVVFSVKGGRIFKVEVNKSIKLDSKILDESRSAMDSFKSHDYSKFKREDGEREVVDADGNKYPSVI